MAAAGTSRRHIRCGTLGVLAGWTLAAIAGCAATSKAPEPPATPSPTSAQAGATTIVAVAPPAQPCCPHPTLWDFLGVKGFAKLLGGGIDRLRNRLGSRFPGLEAKPPLLAITDPANTGPNAPPAAKAAAEAKAYEDAAPQKIKAIRYLATLGCTECYPDIAPALLKALDDCSESVRYEAALALRKLSGGPCAVCQSNRCCNPEIVKRLDELANGTNDQGCYREPSARVRRVARLAIAGCGGVIPPRLPEEGPVDVPPTPAGGPVPAGAGAVAATTTRHLPPTTHSTASNLVRLTSAVEETGDSPELQVMAEVNGEPIWEHEVLNRLEKRLLEAPSGTSARSTSWRLREELEKAIACKLVCQEARRLGFEAPHLMSLVSHPAGVSPTGAVATDEVIAAEWLVRQVAVPSDVSRQEIFAYYRANLEKFQPGAEVRWECLSAPAATFGSRENALKAIHFLRDKAQGVATSPPTGFDIRKVSTNRHDWTRREELGSDHLGHWLSTLPVGTLSPVIEDAQGYQMVRVLERRQPRAVSLEEAAEPIRQELLAQRRRLAEKQIVEGLRREATVWTIFDGVPAATARPAGMSR